MLEFLAQKIDSNIRVLEGALNRVIAYSSFVGRPLTIDMAQEVLKDLIRASQRRITIDDIQRKVADYYNLRLSDLLSARRSRTIARPRQVAMYLSKILTTRSLPEIGRKFGGRDHTTVIHAVKRIEGLRDSDSAIQEEVDLLIAEISRVSENTRFNNQKVLDGTFVNKQLQVGTEGGEQISVNIASSNANMLGAYRVTGDLVQASAGVPPHLESIRPIGLLRV